MAIRVTCACGQAIVTRDEFAGRRVQCKACKKIFALPGQPVTPPRPAVTTQLAPPSQVAPPPAAPPPRTMLMPVAAAPAPVAAAVPPLVQYRCLCGTSYQSQAEHAGRPVRCPLCAHVLFVPRTSDTALPARPVRARSRAESGGRMVLIALFVLLMAAGTAGAAMMLIRPVGDTAAQSKSTPPR